MFTGIISHKGVITKVAMENGKGFLEVESPLFTATKIGSSIAINGVCLTVTTLAGTKATFDVASETQRATTLGSLSCNQQVNLEKALTLGESLDGHIVLGHVDCVGIIKNISKETDTLSVQIEIPAQFEKYLAPKGSIAIDGVSLTLGNVEKNIFTVFIIPHTARETTFSQISPGNNVNIEIDCLARYVEKLITYN